MHTAFLQNKNIGRVINLANALVVPKEGEWGVIIKKVYFQTIKDADFFPFEFPFDWRHTLKRVHHI